MSCLRKMYGKLNWICGGQWLGYIEHIKNFVKSLENHKYKLVFFFDGNTPVSDNIPINTASKYSYSIAQSIMHFIACSMYLK